MLHFRNCYFEGHKEAVLNGRHGMMKLKTTIGQPDHVAIIKDILSDTEVMMYHQNFNGVRSVHTKEIDLSWLKRGSVKAWRAVPHDGKAHDGDVKYGELEAVGVRNNATGEVSRDPDDIRGMQAEMDRDLKRIERERSATPRPPSVSSGIAPGTQVMTNKGYLGTVRWLGQISGAKGDFAGVELDEPKGKNSGDAKGRHYFRCRPKHGLFVRPNTLQALY